MVAKVNLTKYLQVFKHTINLFIHISKFHRIILVTNYNVDNLGLYLMIQKSILAVWKYFSRLQYYLDDKALH